MVREHPGLCQAEVRAGASLLDPLHGEGTQTLGLPHQELLQESFLEAEQLVVLQDTLAGILAL